MLTPITIFLPLTETERLSPTQGLHQHILLCPGPFCVQRSCREQRLFPRLRRIQCWWVSPVYTLNSDHVIFVRQLVQGKYSLLALPWYNLTLIQLGGGGRSIWPPCIKSATASRPPQIATHLFRSFFFQVLLIFWYQVCETRTMGREVTWRFLLARRIKLCPICFLK